MNFLKECAGLVSFTFDSWTSDSGVPFMSITGHYIWAPKDSPQDWELRNEQLAFASLSGHHSGENIATILLEAIQRYDIENKVRFI